jgi:6-phosphogluconolactonase
VGADGHTASLFPGDPALSERDRWVVTVNAPAAFKASKRISLTLPVINSSKEVFFLVSGAEKRDSVERILKDRESVRNLFPAAMVRPRKRLVWFLDGEVFP